MKRHNITLTSFFALITGCFALGYVQLTSAHAATEPAGELRPLSMLEAEAEALEAELDSEGFLFPSLMLDTAND